MFTRRTVDRLFLLLKAMAVFVLVTALLAFAFPSRNASFTQNYLDWASKLAVGIPVWFAIEFAGTKFLDLTLFARLSSPARIAAVTAITALSILVYILGVDFVKYARSL